MKVKIKLFILLGIFVPTAFVLASISPEESFSFRLYCKLASLVNDDDSKCFNKITTIVNKDIAEIDTLQKDITTLKKAVASLSATQSNEGNVIPSSIKEESGLKYIYIKGEKGDKGDKGDQGISGTSINLSSQAFQNIPQPFWNGAGASGNQSQTIIQQVSGLPTGGTAGQILTINASGTPEWITSSGGGPFSLLAQNGLTLSTTSTTTNIQLGGSLGQDTTIDTQGNKFLITEPIYTSPATGFLKSEGYFLSGQYDFPVGDVPQFLAEGSPSLSSSLFTGLVRTYDDIGGTNRTMRAGFHTTECGDPFLAQDLCTSYEIGNLSNSNYQQGIKVTRDVTSLLAQSAVGKVTFLISGQTGLLQSQIFPSGKSTSLEINQNNFDGVRFSHNTSFYTFPTSTPLVGQVLTAIDVVGQLGWSNQLSGNASSTNGLTMYPSGIGLGGTSTQDTVITQNSFNFETRRVPPTNTSSFFALENRQRTVPLNPAFTSYNVDHAGAYAEKTYSSPTNIGFSQLALGTSTFRAGLFRGVGEAGTPYFDAYNYIPLSDTSVDVHRIYNSNYGPAMYYDKYNSSGGTLLRSYAQTRNDGGFYAVGSAPASSTRSDINLFPNGNILLRSYDLGSKQANYTADFNTGISISHASVGLTTIFSVATSTGVTINDLGTQYGLPRTGVASGTIVGFNDATGQLKFLTLAQLGVSTSTPSSGWSLTGNAGTNASTTFLGTIDNQDLVFKTNNATTGVIRANGKSFAFGLGAQALVSDMNVMGNEAGFGATDTYYSNFFGYRAGYQADFAEYANFIGASAGSEAESAFSSNFIGASAGLQATNAWISNFIGVGAGLQATNARLSNFIGNGAGNSATNAYFSNFIGRSAGSQATNAAYSIFIGLDAGLSDTVDNTASSDMSSILIGNNTNTGGFSNSIALGAYTLNTAARQLNIGNSIYATNLHVGPTQSGSPVAISFVGIGTATPATKLQVFGDVRVGDSGTNGCVQRFDGAALTGTCTSDENLKKDIVPLTNVLSSLIKLVPSTYSWNETAVNQYKYGASTTITGLIAQNVETVFPSLVSINTDGYRVVDTQPLQYYTIQAIKDLNEALGDPTNETTTPESFTASSIFKRILTGLEWMGVKIENGIVYFSNLFAKEAIIERLCFDEAKTVCLTQDEVTRILEVTQVTSSPEPAPSPEMQPVDEVSSVTVEQVEDASNEPVVENKEEDKDSSQENTQEESVPSTEI